MTFYTPLLVPFLSEFGRLFCPFGRHFFNYEVRQQPSKLGPGGWLTTIYPTTQKIDVRSKIANVFERVDVPAICSRLPSDMIAPRMNVPPSLSQQEVEQNIPKVTKRKGGSF